MPTKKILLLLGLVFLTGCASIGPETVARDRFDYVTAISDSWKKQMLLNKVKIRYSDAPVFLDVGSIISQYAVEAQLNASVGWNWGAVSGNNQLLGGSGRYAERPTITYSPLMGEQFTRSLMTPIPPAAILSLIQAGYPVDSVFRVCVHAVNGIQNRSGAAAMARAADPEFYELIRALRRIQQSGDIGSRTIRAEKEKKEATVLVLRRKVGKDMEAQIAIVQKILGLKPGLSEIRVVYGSLPKDDQEIAILSRSMFEILVELASHIDVPAAHVAEQRVNPTARYPDEEKAGIQPLFQMKSGLAEPADAYVAVPFKGYWFWIDDRDLPSKRLFSFLMFLFTLAETGAPKPGPVVTIPTG